MSPIGPRKADSLARLLGAAIAGAVVAVVGGLIGLGGAEYRLPLLLGPFGFPPLQAVILNKALSLVVVATALPARGVGVPWGLVADHWTTAANVLAGSIVGAWFGAGWATRLRSETLSRVIAVLFVGIAVVLVLGQQTQAPGMAPGFLRVVLGVVLGVGIGVVAALLGVAGGELLIPTFVLLFGLNIKLAGSLSLVVSLPTMLTGFSRYSRDRSFVVLRERAPFLAAMAAGSIAGSALGGALVGLVPSGVLLPALSLILLVSAFGLWRHRSGPVQKGDGPGGAP
jgi:uncharacterized membrane protein YfcA